MRIILTKEIKRLGVPGDVVKVANGYARNYLLPQKMAVLATAYNLSKVESIKQQAQAEREAMLNALRETAAKLNGTEVVFTRKVDDNNSLYGSVSETDIVHALKGKGFDVHKSMLRMEKHLKELGEIGLTVSFGHEVTATIKVKIEKEQ